MDILNLIRISAKALMRNKTRTALSMLGIVIGIAAVIAVVNLGEGLKQSTANQLSGGQQQRVAIARALVNDPVIVLADEATGNLDTRTSYEIMSLFQSLHEQGKTIAFVTHESDIAVFTSRTVFLRDGHILRDEPVATKSAIEALKALPIENDY